MRRFSARQAGLEKFTLLEEPQAAFYDFTARHTSRLAQTLADVRLVLVVDVGGGTSDFTLVQVSVTADGPVLRRIGVGDHLMLGGDNMDATLARRLEERMTAGGRKLGTAKPLHVDARRQVTQRTDERAGIQVARRLTAREKNSGVQETGRLKSAGRIGSLIVKLVTARSSTG